MTELLREAKKYQSAHLVASKTNQELKEAVSLHATNLNTLKKHPNEIMKSLPSCQQSGRTFELTC